MSVEQCAGSQRAAERFIHSYSCPVTDGNAVSRYMHISSSSSSSNMTCTLLPDVSFFLFLLPPHKRNNRMRQSHTDKTFLMLPCLQLLFIRTLTDTVCNRDVWSLSVLWLNHIANGTGCVLQLWSPLKDWQSDWWAWVSPTANSSPCRRRTGETGSRQRSW